MESNSPPATIAKRLLHIFRVVCYMLRKGISKNKLMMELHSLLKRSKLVGKALSNLMTFHGHSHHSSQYFSSAYSSFSCRSMDPNLSFYNPQEIDFSFSNTPSFITKQKNHHRKNNSYDYEAITAIARAFETMNKNSSNSNNNNEVVSDAEESVAPSPIVGFIWKSTPMTVRKLRITDSPFPIREDEEANDGRVDKEAEEFINRFYEQLRMQQDKSKGISRG